MCWENTIAQLGSTLLDVIKVSARVRERFSLSFPAWHLPKVLILQSASARTGRGSHFFGSRYLRQVPGRTADEEEGKEPRDCCVWSSYHVGCKLDPEDGTLRMRTLIM